MKNSPKHFPTKTRKIPRKKSVKTRSRAVKNGRAEMDIHKVDSLSYSEIIIQVLAVFCLLVAVSRCSPLSPSMSQDELHKSQIPATGAPNSNSVQGEKAISQVSQSELSPELQSHPIDGEVKITYTQNGQIPRDQSRKIVGRIQLTNEEIQGLKADSSSLAIMLAARIDASGAIRKLQNSISERKVVAHIFIDEQKPLDHLEKETLERADLPAFMNANSQDVLLQIQAFPQAATQELLRRSLEKARSVVLDIHGNS